MNLPDDQSDIVRLLFKNKDLLLQWYPNNPYFNKQKFQISDIWSYMAKSKDTIIHIYFKILAYHKEKNSTPRRIAFRNASILGHTND